MGFNSGFKGLIGEGGSRIGKEMIVSKIKKQVMVKFWR